MSETKFDPPRKWYVRRHAKDFSNTTVVADRFNVQDGIVTFWLGYKTVASFAKGAWEEVIGYQEAE